MVFSYTDPMLYPRWGVINEIGGLRPPNIPRVQASWSKKISSHNSDPLDFIISTCRRVLQEAACSHHQGPCGSYVSIAWTPLILFAKSVCDFISAKPLCMQMMGSATVRFFGFYFGMAQAGPSKCQATLGSRST